MKKGNVRDLCLAPKNRCFASPVKLLFGDDCEVQKATHNELVEQLTLPKDEKTYKYFIKELSNMVEMGRGGGIYLESGGRLPFQNNQSHLLNWSTTRCWGLIIDGSTANYLSEIPPLSKKPSKSDVKPVKS